MACLKFILFVLTCPLWVATPGFAQDVLWGTTRYLGPQGGGTVFSVASTGADFAVHKAFANPPMRPSGSLVKGRDGYLYGVSQEQHGYGYEEAETYGTAFKMSPTGEITVVKVFRQFDGIYPVGDLVEGRDGNFYGMTSMGGSNFVGTVFKLSPAGALTTLVSFNYGNGADPRGSLVEGRDGNFYGMTSGGGNNGAGTIFRVSLTGTFTVLKHFGYADGSYPMGSLVQGSDGNFYGMTSGGGSSDVGTVFRISPAGTFTTLNNFDYANGAYPQGSLVQGNDGDFYGMVSKGGAHGRGTIVKISSSGTLTVLKSFAADYVEGTGPLGNLVQGRDGNFYGMTNEGGGYGYGNVFRMSPAGTVTVLKDFTWYQDGAYPLGSLVEGPDGDFYGMTHLGGSSDYSGFGTAFKVSPEGTFTIINTFGFAAGGTHPEAGLARGRDGNFYGTTGQGGSRNQGTVYTVSPTGTHTVLETLLNGTPVAPQGNLVQGRDGNFYSVRPGNYWDPGAIFKISPTGAVTVLKSFNYSGERNPAGSLVEGRDGKFYGVTTEGGNGNSGTVFTISPTGAFTILKHFTGADGAYPKGGLVEGRDGDFYGTTSRGGSMDVGTLFKISPAGAHTVLKEFTFDEGNEPMCGLVQGSDGDFYGATSYGGSYYTGTIFKISADGAFTVLKEFNGFDGYLVQGSLVEGSGGDFYGVTRKGGDNDLGTLFKISATGTHTILRSFAEADGVAPLGGLVIVKQACTPPVLAAVPADTTVHTSATECGASVAFAASATGTPAPGITYQIGNEVITSPYVFPVGTTTVTATAANGCGRVTKSFTVTVVDKTVPVPWTASLPDVTGECAVKITETPGAHDNCTGLYLAATTTDPLEYTAQGTYTVTWTYRDAGGNTTTQTQKVVVQDRTAPVPVVATLPEATGDCSITVTVPRATDNCRGSLTATTTDPTTYTTQGTFVIHWRYDDGRGNVTEQPQTVIVKDVTNPVLTAPAALTLTNDPGQCGRSLAGIALGTPIASDNCGGLKPATHDAPAFFPAGTTTVTWTVEDAAGNRSTAAQRVTVANADPVVGTITAPVSPVGINTAVTASAAFTDNNLTEATWDWGNGTTPGTIDQANGKITGSRTYGTPGVHTVTLTVTDACGKTAASTFRYVVVYDPNGGFVTGGGWIHSPANAYAPNPAAAGTARFGFVSRYQKGATQPVGTTGFEFEAAGLAFRSTSYEWLVVAGAQAQYKGAGALNGEPGYKFILTASDAQVNGGSGADRFRIKIWKDGETVPVYDNQRGAADDATATTAIGGGSILVHDDRSKAREGAEVRVDAPVAATLRGFPNPFSGKTTIEFTLARDEAYALDVYDLNGRLVTRLGAAQAEAGRANRVVWEAKTAPGGVYFARLVTRSGVQHLKLVLK